MGIVIKHNEIERFSNFLEDLEKLMTRYYNQDWSYEWDYDKPITIHVPIEE
tara:strand:+ start:1336 stop:1488 length:153 start_codon:yes stop_codon:yes gene_type:complete